jgi:hypothetical protein
MVTTINITIGDKSYTFTMKEAEQLYQDLEKIFGKKENPTFVKEIPWVVRRDPVQPWLTPTDSPYPYPIITCQCKTSDSIAAV